MIPRTMPIDRHLCALLKLQRVACGVSTEALAKRIGSTVSEIEGYEAGGIALTLEGFLTIARALGSPRPAAVTLLEEAGADELAQDDARVAALLASQRGRQVVHALAHCEDPLVFAAFADLLLSVSMTQRSLPPHRRPTPAGVRA